MKKTVLLSLGFAAALVTNAGIKDAAVMELPQPVNRQAVEVKEKKVVAAPAVSNQKVVSAGKLVKSFKNMGIYQTKDGKYVRVLNKNNKLNLNSYSKPKAVEAAADASFSENFDGWDGETANWLPTGWSQESKVGSDANVTWGVAEGNFYAMAYDTYSLNITAAMVSELRARTSVGMMDCKKALVECDGDMERACDYLREKGLAKAAKKAERTAAQGRMFTYVHSNAKLAVLLELDCETDFVARTDEFLTLGHEIAMHIAAANPSYIKPEDVPADVLEHEKMVIMAQAREEGKPEKMLEKIAEGRINKFYEENCLMEQKYIRDPNVKIKDLIIENIAKIGENIVVRRYARFAIEA